MSEELAPSGTSDTPNAGSTEEKAVILAEWSSRLSAELGLELAVDLDAILSLAGVAAHTVIRPAAPLTTFLVGYAAGVAAAQGNSATAIEAAMATAQTLLQASATGTPPTSGTPGA